MSNRSRPVFFWVLFVLLVGEFALVAVVAVTLLIELLTGEPSSYPTAIALTVLAFLAAAWLGAIVVGALRGQAWVRGSAVVWQVLQFALGAGGVSGAFSSPGIGWPLIAVALVAFLLLLSKPVVDDLATRSDRASS